MFKRAALSLLAIAAMCSSNVLAQTTITAAFSDFSGGNDQAFQQNGDTTVVATSLRLTRNVNNLFGTAFYRERVSLANQRSFSSHFSFRMTNPTCFIGDGADGLAFVVQTDSNTAGTAGGGIGYQGISPSVAIEFDTFLNSPFDPDNNHIGLSINGDTASIQTVTPSDILNDGSTYYVWVDYNGSTSSLELRFSATSTRPGSAILTRTVDLSSVIGQDVFVGFTAATGGCNENHFIDSFFFNNDFLTGGIDPGSTTYQSGPASITLTGTSSIVANGTDTGTYIATPLNALGTPIPGASITFSSDIGTASPTVVVANGAGQATTTLTSLVPGAATLRASGQGGVFKTLPVTLSISPPNVTSGNSTVDSTPVISGTGPANAIIKVYIDGVYVGMTNSNSSGAWSFTVPTALTSGSHTVNATAEVNGITSDLGIVQTLNVRGEVVLDFDGDGFTDITAMKVSSRSVAYFSRQSSDQQVVNTTVTGSIPVPADYDGDGIWDFAAVQVDGNKLIWNANLSGSSQQSIELGRSTDAILTGCRLLTPFQYSAVAVQGPAVKIREFGSAATVTRNLQNLGSRNLLGCGDVNGDGKDELIYSISQSKGAESGVIAIDLNGTKRAFKRVLKLPRAVIVRRTENSTPLLGVVSWVSASRRLTRFEGIASTFKFPLITTSGKTIDIGSGAFPDGSAVRTGLTWQELGSRRINQKLLKSGATVTTSTVPSGYRLTRPQAVHKVTVR